MLHIVQSLSNSKLRFFLFALAGCTLLGCSLFDTRPSVHSQMETVIKQRIFFASYDSVWSAIHKVVKYPIAQENQDTGRLETEFIKGIDGWLPPDAQDRPSAGVRYKLIFTVAKGRTDGRDSTRVTIDKKMEILRDFFSPPEPLESDGLEEKVLFYRIERELVIGDVLKRIPLD